MLRPIDEAIAIWNVGVASVDPARLINQTVCCRQKGELWRLQIGENEETLLPGAHLIVVGMGKASAKMAQALEEVLAPLIAQKRLRGWVNVPDNMVGETQAIHLHGARPPQLNEPTAAGVYGSEKIVAILESASPNDLIITLISGGGSALSPLPVNGISLEEKLAITRFLSGAGANIEELNTVRKELSLLKGGGMRRLCNGKRLYSLILSDVLGDPLDVIASGPTVVNRSNAGDALQVLDHFGAANEPTLAGVYPYIKKVATHPALSESLPSVDDSRHHNLIIGNNVKAVEAAAGEAINRGFQPYCESANHCEGLAEEVGERLYRMSFTRPMIISGGEPVVRLAPSDKRGRGGRNQQMVLAALILALELKQDAIPVFLCGGTDGEDGPTDAAGAWFDGEIVEQVRQQMVAGLIDPIDYLNRNDAWSFFDRFDALLRPGATGTNVCDLRIVFHKK